MSLLGRCRCGNVLDFKLGPAGYKTLCPRCGAVVRLRVPLAMTRGAEQPPVADAQVGGVGAAISEASVEDAEATARAAADGVGAPTLPPAAFPYGETDPPGSAGESETEELSAEEVAALDTPRAPSDVSALIAAASPGFREFGARGCPACGELVALGRTICRHCGTLLEKAPEPRTRRTQREQP